MKEGLNKMSHQFLYEIGLEELPARFITDLEAQLKNLVSQFLNDQGLAYSKIKSYSTPRRLAVQVWDLADSQEDKTESFRGPAKKIALDQDGQWTKAALGFAKGQGMSADDIVFKEDKGQDYAFIEKFRPGQKADQVLEDISQVVSGLTAPVSMKWGDNHFRFVRPVHQLVCLLDDLVIDSSLFNVSSGRKTDGHRFLGETLELASAENYEKALKNQYVIADRQDRQEDIARQIEALCQDKNWQSPLYNQALLDEVTDLVEYPTVFFGEFDSSFLSVPERILETSMADHQRYFPVRSKLGDFLPYFIGVRNGNEAGLENVVAGNEKVLVARLEDAKFFYQEDKDHSIDYFLNQLDQVTYHDKLGSMQDKQDRVGQICLDLLDYVSLTQAERDDLSRAAAIYKFDLVTAVVDEFSSLQGYIGGVYAQEFGESQAVAQAIGEQYLPTSSRGDLPESKLGSILAMADKLESLLMFFSINLIPSGSNDPYALRRAAYGLIRILDDQDLSLDLTDFFYQLAQDLGIEDTHFIEKLDQFIKERVDKYLEAQYQIPHDIRQAAISGLHLNPVKAIKVGQKLAEDRGSQDYKFMVESLSRVANMTQQETSHAEVDPDLAQSQSEEDLIKASVFLLGLFQESDDITAQYEALKEISPKIEAFFDNNMVNTEDDQVRANRYAILDQITQASHSFADFNQLLTK